MTINYKKLGKKIKELRLLKGLSQEQLAEKCDLSTSYISYIETGKKKINFSQLEKISNELNFVVDIYSEKSSDFDISILIEKFPPKEKVFLCKILTYVISQLEAYCFDS